MYYTKVKITSKRKWQFLFGIAGIVALSIWVISSLPFVVDTESSLAHSIGFEGGRYAHDFIRDMGGPKLDFLSKYPTFTTKVELTAFDAIRNSFLIFTFSAAAVACISVYFLTFSIVAPIAALAQGVVALFQGHLTATLILPPALFVLGIIGAVLGSIFTALACLWYFAYLPFQHGTEGYQVIMFLLGAPFVLGGIATGGSAVPSVI